MICLSELEIGIEQMKYGKENNLSKRNVKYAREILGKIAHIIAGYKYTFMCCR